MIRYSILPLLPVFTLLDVSSAATLTFDSDLEGAVISDNFSSLEHSVDHGGSMKATSVGGWAGSGAKLNLRQTVLWDEVKLAATNGGSLNFDLIVVGSEQTLVGDLAPNWFQVVVIGNSTNSGAGGTGGWDQEVVNFGLNEDAWPLDPNVRSFNVSVDILSSGPIAGDNGGIFLDTNEPGGWTELVLGLNNDSSAVSGATAYFDNISVVAIPEPSTYLLLLLASFSVLRRKK